MRKSLLAGIFLTCLSLACSRTQKPKSDIQKQNEGKLPVDQVPKQQEVVDSSSSKKTTSGWKTFTGLAGFYSVKHPSNWKASREGNIVNIVPPDQSGAVTISAFHGDAPIPNFSKKWLSDSFNKETPTSKLAQHSLNGWKGFRQTFRDSAQFIDWIAIVAEKGKVFILITANEQISKMGERKQAYEGILRSLVLKDPEQKP